jgi:hypothetical protein
MTKVTNQALHYVQERVTPNNTQYTHFNITNLKRGTFNVQYIFNCPPASDICIVLHKNVDISQAKNQQFYTILIFQYSL